MLLLLLLLLVVVVLELLVVVVVVVGLLWWCGLLLWSPPAPWLRGIHNFHIVLAAAVLLCMQIHENDGGQEGSDAIRVDTGNGQAQTRRLDPARDGQKDRDRATETVMRQTDRQEHNDADADREDKQTHT